MKEQEVIEVLSDFNKQVSAKADGAYQSTIGEMACNMAIKALEEVQQYRNLGSIMELKVKLKELERWHSYHLAKNVKNPFAKMSTTICHNCDHKDEYIEELEAEIEQYRVIGTPEECRAAVEKQQTVYDVDKVMKQLEGLRKECEDPLQDYCPNYFIDKAVDIVKGGVVNGN